MNTDVIIDRITRALGGIRGIDAIVLGGSRATGSAGAASDIDIGIYYSAGLDMDMLRERAAAIDDLHRPDCMTAIGEWGPWINGGGWLTVDGMPVDLLLRNTERVESCVDDCINGRITIDYQCGHPFGFVNSIYMGEVALCRELYSGSDALARLKDRLRDYPPLYRRAAMDKFVWESGFSLACGRKAANKHDVLYASGSLFRAGVAQAYALYALNRMYCINEKGCLARLESDGAVMPHDLRARTEAALRLEGSNIAQAFDALDALHAEVAALCAEADKE